LYTSRILGSFGESSSVRLQIWPLAYWTFFLLSFLSLISVAEFSVGHYDSSNFCFEWIFSIRNPHDINVLCLEKVVDPLLHHQQVVSLKLAINGVFHICFDVISYEIILDSPRKTTNRFTLCVKFVLRHLFCRSKSGRDLLAKSWLDCVSWNKQLSCLCYCTGICRRFKDEVRKSQSFLCLRCCWLTTELWIGQVAKILYGASTRNFDVERRLVSGFKRFLGTSLICKLKRLFMKSFSWQTRYADRRKDSIFMITVHSYHRIELLMHWNTLQICQTRLAKVARIAWTRRFLSIWQMWVLYWLFVVVLFVTKPCQFLFLLNFVFWAVTAKIGSARVHLSFFQIRL